MKVPYLNNTEDNTGIIFKPSGVFSHAIKYLYNKALKATFCVRWALKAESINTELYLKIKWQSFNYFGVIVIYW